jgi:hypothetical protein
MSIRVDHIAELIPNENATKLPVNYGFAKINFMPERMEGEVTTQEIRQIDENIRFANPALEKDAVEALSSNKRQYFGAHRDLDDGYPVGIRIDIPAFTSKGVYVVTVHEKKKGGERGQVGERIGYDTIAKVDNPVFFSNEVGAKKIKSGEANKFPVATVEGQFNSSREIPEDINEWTPVGYNPREHSYFYDKRNDEPVLSGDEAISVGNTVFVKNPVYGDKANFAFMPQRQQDETIKPVDLQTSAKPESDAVIKPFSNALVSSAGLINFLPAYHGTPFEVDKFKLANIGTGEGAQAYGWGLYFAQARKTGEKYRNDLSGYDELTIFTDKGKKKGQQLDDLDMEAAKYLESGARTAGQFKHNTVYYAKQAAERDGKQDVVARIDEYGRDAKVTYEKNLGNLYKVDIDVKDEDLLDWDKPLSEQPESVRDAITALINERTPKEIADSAIENMEAKGGSLYALISDSFGESAQGTPEKRASEALLAAGIPGIRYLDGTSRKQGEGTYNYVVFDENLITILDKNDKPVAGELPTKQPLSGIQFMPQRGEGKKPKTAKKELEREIEPDFTHSVDGKLPPQTPERGYFKIATNPTEDGRVIEYELDPQTTVLPNVANISSIEGEQVAMLEADRHNTRGSNMGGPLHPFLISNQAVAKLPDGRGFKPVWANMTAAFVTRAKNIINNTTSGMALIQLMKEKAHKSNRKFVQDVMSEVDSMSTSIPQERLDALHVILELGAKNPAKHLNRYKKAQKLLKDNEITQSEFNLIERFESKKIEQYKPSVDFLNALGSMKSQATKGNVAAFDKAFDEHISKYKDQDWYKKIVAKYKNKTFAEEASKFTFNQRGSAMDRISGMPFIPSIAQRLLESMDFNKGKNLDIVAAVQLSKDMDAFAIYTGDDPKQEAKMSATERYLRDQFLKNPQFKIHPSYDWMMLGPEDANNFILETPADPVKLFPDYASSHPKKTVREGSKETIVGTMKKSKIPLILK